MIELRDYQKAMVGEIVKRNNLLVVAPMGAGKTLSTLTASAAFIYRESVKNVLIIAPKRVSMSVWAQEAEQFNMGLTIRYCQRAVDIKLFLLEPANHHICVCSVTRIDEIPHGCWDVVIIDESTLFGNKTSKRSKEARRICSKNVTATLKKDPRYFPMHDACVTRRIELSGTPVHGGYEKLWHQIFLLDGGKALGSTLGEFRARYMRIKYQVNGVVTVWEMRPEMVAQLWLDVRHLVYVVKDSVALPDLLPKVVYVDLPAKRKSEYVEFEQTSVIRFQEEEQKACNPYDDTKTLVAFAASARGMKLRQLASGTVYTDAERKTYSVTHTEKVEALKELVEAVERGVLVAYQFKAEYEELKKAFPKARRLENAEDIADWNAGKIDVALVHPQSIGHGLNLQHGGCVVVWYSLTYDAELYAQLNKRLHRSGQKDPVSIVHLIARGTIDEKLLKVVQSKEDAANEFTKN